MDNLEKLETDVKELKKKMKSYLKLLNKTFKIYQELKSFYILNND